VRLAEIVAPSRGEAIIERAQQDHTEALQLLLNWDTRQSILSPRILRKDLMEINLAEISPNVGLITAYNVISVTTGENRYKSIKTKLIDTLTRQSINEDPIRLISIRSLSSTISTTNHVLQSPLLVAISLQTRL